MKGLIFPRLRRGKSAWQNVGICISFTPAVPVNIFAFAFSGVCAVVRNIGKYITFSVNLLPLCISGLCVTSAFYTIMYQIHLRYFCKSWSRILTYIICSTVSLFLYSILKLFYLAHVQVNAKVLPQTEVTNYFYMHPTRQQECMRKYKQNRLIIAQA